MDGFEVLKAMNANHTIEDIPVIMISSEDSDATIRRSYEPVSYTHLLSEISLRADKISTQVSRSCCRKLRSTCIPSTLGLSLIHI